MIYLDSSVALAHILKEERLPPTSFWHEPLVSSRLLEYEIWNQIHAYGFGQSHADEVHAMIGRVSLVELLPPMLERALEPFPTRVRTLDALHLASIEFVQKRGQDVHLASYDARLAEAARALGIPVLPL